MVISQFPERAQGLMAYMAEIAKASVKYKWPSWVIYDQKYRMEAAETQKADWSKIEPSIYAQCFHGMEIAMTGWCVHCYSIDHISDSCMFKPKKRTQAPSPSPSSSKYQQLDQLQQPICKKYNNFNGKCSFGASCRYRHWCSNCKKPGHYKAICSQPAVLQPSQ